MTSDGFQAELKARSTGSTVDGLRQPALRKCLVKLPSYKTQINISNYLSLYDDLIENLQNQIDNLEQTAELLYREWFVHFRFPGYENYEFEKEKLKKWVIGDKLEIDIPKSFKIDNLSKIGKFIRGKNIISDDMIEGNIPVISAGVNPSGFHNVANVYGKSLTISASGANAGYLSYHNSNIWAADCSYYQNDKNIWFVYCSLKFLQSYISNLQCGAAQPHVYPKHINKTYIIIPPVHLIEKFNDLVTPIFDNIYQIHKQINNLTIQRDLLLPRLMSGKLDIIDYKKQPEDNANENYILSFVEFKQELYQGMAARATNILDKDIEAAYRAYVNDRKQKK